MVKYFNLYEENNINNNNSDNKNIKILSPTNEDLYLIDRVIKKIGFNKNIKETFNNKNNKKSFNNKKLNTFNSKNNFIYFFNQDIYLISLILYTLVLYSIYHNKKIFVWFFIFLAFLTQYVDSIIYKKNINNNYLSFLNDQIIILIKIVVFIIMYSLLLSKKIAFNFIKSNQIENNIEAKQSVYLLIFILFILIILIYYTKKNQKKCFKKINKNIYSIKSIKSIKSINPIINCISYISIIITLLLIIGFINLTYNKISNIEKNELLNIFIKK